MKTKAAVLVLLCVVAGCSRSQETVLGQPPATPVADLSAARQVSKGTVVTISGKMIEKCPEAGCWFVMQDGPTKVRVDTKTAGFVVVEVPVNQKLTVSGTWYTNGSEVVLGATGLRY